MSSLPTVEIETLTDLAGVWATSRKDLIVALMPFASLEAGDNALLTVTLPCGNVETYQTMDDIPTESRQCACDEKPSPHYFVQYSDDEEEE